MPSSPGYIRGPLIIPGVVAVTLKWALPNGKLASNVLHGNNFFGTAVNLAMANSIHANIALDARWTAYALTLADTVALQNVHVRDLNVGLAPEFVSDETALPGTNGSDVLPEGVALVCTLKSAVAGRSGRGRVYLTGFGSDQLDAVGHAVAGLTAAAADFVTAVSEAMTAASLSLTIAHRAHGEYTSPFTGETVLAVPASDSLVEQILVVDNVFDSQRRRK